MVLAAGEFIRRFLLHTLPDGLHRIRHYGFLANRERAEKLALCRRLLAADPALACDADPPGDGTTAAAFDTCPCCGGPMIIRAIVPPAGCRQTSFRHDTS